MISIKKYFFGFKSFWISFSILREKKELKKYLYIPVAIAVLFFFMAVYFAFGPLPEYFLSFLSLEPGLLSWIISALFHIFAFLFIILGTFVLANIVTVPFNTILCEQYWKLEYGWKPKQHSFISMLKLMLYFLVIGMLKAILLALIAVLCFALSFIPVLSLFIAFIGLLMITFDCCDISFELLEKGLGQRFKFFKKYFIEFTGFASAMAIVAVIPGFNLFFLPFMVLGASHMVYELNRGSK